MPELDVKKIKTLNCDILGIFGTQDKFINPDVVKKFEENMKAARQKVEDFTATMCGPRYLPTPATLNTTKHLPKRRTVRLWPI